LSQVKSGADQQPRIEIDHSRHVRPTLVNLAILDFIGKMKQFVCYFTHGVRNGSELRRNVHTARTPAEILDYLDAFFAQTVT
jgi:tRNA-dihydrouridine synthase